MATMTRDQFQAALEDYAALSAVFSRMFPGEVSENLLSHLEHCLRNPIALDSIFRDVEAVRTAIARRATEQQNQTNGAGAPTRTFATNDRAADGTIGVHDSRSLPLSGPGPLTTHQIPASRFG